MAPPIDRYRLPARITGSSWGNVAAAARRTATSEAAGDDGVLAPVWSAREALALVAAWREIARATHDGMPYWYQFAASALGWSPDTDVLVQSEAQAAAPYPPEDAAALVIEMDRIAAARDAVQGGPAPALVIRDVWTDPDVLSAIHDALEQDGASAQWKIPLPACKDPKTGRPSKPVRDPATGKWSCPGGAVTIDDPITAIGKSLSKLAPLAIVVGALWVYDIVDRKSRRRRR